jgi:hypothetical protein
MTSGAVGGIQGPGLRDGEGRQFALVRHASAIGRQESVPQLLLPQMMLEQQSGAQQQHEDERDSRKNAPLAAEYCGLASRWRVNHAELIV